MGQNLILTHPDGSQEPLENRGAGIKITSGKQNMALNADDTLNITVEAYEPHKYYIGDMIRVFGRDYKLNRLPKVTRNGARAFVYELEFEGIQYDLLRATYDLTIDTTNNTLQDVSGDSLTGDLGIFMRVLIANANRVFPGKWKLGECPETEADKTLTFGESDNCLSALQTLCSETNFNKEFEIVAVNGVYTINIEERAGSILPYQFMYGKGKGLYEIVRENVSSANIITRLKVYGSTENITHKYRADRLCLPGKTKGQSFIEKADAITKYGVFEARKNFDDIKPTYTGTVSSVVSGSVTKFVDGGFPFDLNEKDADGNTKYLVAGMAAQIHFNTGNLAGYEFTVSSYDHATKTFTLNTFEDERGAVFPSADSAAFQFKAGDKYKITDITYSDDIVNEAEARLAEQANTYYDQNCQPKVQYGIKLDKEFLKELVAAAAGDTANVFMPGDYLRIIDDEIGVDKSIRVKSLTRDLLSPYDYTLTISDTVTNAGIITRVISDLIDIDKVLEINNLKDPRRARANWRSSREVMDMVFDPEGDYYTEKIKPNSIDTLALSVGAKSMQFGLTNTVFQPNYGGNKNAIQWKGGVLTHYTIDPDKAVSWNLANGSQTFGSDTAAYYIYARCSRSNNAGTIVFDTKQHVVDENANYYYFWIGVLNSVDSDLNARALSLTYGFSMINGRFIKTGRVESADGNTYFDLDNNEIGGRINFKDGLISGFVGVAGTTGAINSGISGEGTDAESVRFWAGATNENRAKAVFRVLNNGALYASQAELNGSIKTPEGGLSNDAKDVVCTETTLPNGTTIQICNLVTPVRFWAGKAYTERRDAPFRVYGDGSVFMNNATLEGNIKFLNNEAYIEVATSKPTIVINSSNYSKYITLEQADTNNSFDSGNYLVPTITFDGHANIVFDRSLTYGSSSPLFDGTRPDGKKLSSYMIFRLSDYNLSGDAKRSYIMKHYGTSFSITNNTDKTIYPQHMLNASGLGNFAEIIELGVDIRSGVQIHMFTFKYGSIAQPGGVTRLTWCSVFQMDSSGNIKTSW
ncbi:MAG: hypothetical protein NC324_02490 [Bacteroides sp.]|nr:hypothetical protein [Bacteroides sp.]